MLFVIVSSRLGVDARVASRVWTVSTSQ